MLTFYSSPDSSGKERPTGDCRGNILGGGCGIFVQGDTNKTCEMSGNEMWYHYQDIRDIGGCEICGAFRRKDGCMLKVDFVGKCHI